MYGYGTNYLASLVVGAGLVVTSLTPSSSSGSVQPYGTHAYGTGTFGAGRVVTSNTPIGPTGSGSVQPYGTHAYGTGTFGAGQVVTSNTPIGPTSGGKRSGGRIRRVVEESHVSPRIATAIAIEASLLPFLTVNGEYYEIKIS